jgi:Domain of unknown function (DUF4260)
MSDHESPGAAGGVRTMLRFEGLLLLTAALLFYAHAGTSWTLFLALFLVPDLSFAFYLFGARVGAAAYNVMHMTAGPIILALASQLDLARYGVASAHLFLPVALIWFAHVGLDRALGYGLKYASGFADTHLGAIGKKRHQPA